MYDDNLQDLQVRIPMQEGTGPHCPHGETRVSSSPRPEDLDGALVVSEGQHNFLHQDLDRTGFGLPPLSPRMGLCPGFLFYGETFTATLRPPPELHYL